MNAKQIGKTIQVQGKQYHVAGYAKFSATGVEEGKHRSFTYEEYFLSSPAGTNHTLSVEEDWIALEKKIQPDMPPVGLSQATEKVHIFTSHGEQPLVEKGTATVLEQQGSIGEHLQKGQRFSFYAYQYGGKRYAIEQDITGTGVKTDSYDVYEVQELRFADVRGLGGRQTPTKRKKKSGSLVWLVFLIIAFAWALLQGALSSGASYDCTDSVNSSTCAQNNYRSRLGRSFSGGGLGGGGK